MALMSASWYRHRALPITQGWKERVMSFTRWGESEKKAGLSTAQDRG